MRLPCLAASFPRTGSRLAQVATSRRAARVRHRHQDRSVRNPHIGSDFDEFLHKEGILDAVQAVAVKRVEISLVNA
jgi:hypothetical protein